MTQNKSLREAEMYLRLERVAALKNLERAERAEAERDALRAQLDAMTTEWGVAYKGFLEPQAVAEMCSEAEALRHVGEGDVVVKRLVCPWVEVTD